MVGFGYQWRVYLLGCNDGSFYVGFTTDLSIRIEQHNSGMGSKYTSSRYPVKLLWARGFGIEQDARMFEHKIKRWGKMKKHLLIQGKIYGE